MLGSQVTPLALDARELRWFESSHPDNSFLKLLRCRSGRTVQTVNLVFKNHRRFESYRSSAKFGMLVELITMPPCHGGGRGFESRTSRK